MLAESKDPLGFRIHFIPTKHYSYQEASEESEALSQSLGYIWSNATQTENL